MLFKLPPNPTGLNQKGIALIEAGIQAILPPSLMQDHLDVTAGYLTVAGKRFSLKNRRLFVIGLGKSAAPMAHFLETKIKSRITAGLVIGTRHQPRLKKIRYVAGSHPYPSPANLKATRQILDLKEKHQINRHDLILCLISGGGSALCVLPAPGLTLKEKQATTRLLLKSSAPITEINCVRKHLSQVKGGQLARHFQPAPLLSLIISDVIGDDLGVIASGPTYFDNTTFHRAQQILKKYKIWSKIPPAVKNHLIAGQQGDQPETPPKIQPGVHNFIIGNNQTALAAMKRQARCLKFQPTTIKQPLEAEISHCASIIFNKIKKLLTQSPSCQHTSRQTSTPLALVWGGEPTVDIGNATGLGGRNQELSLRILRLIQQAVSSSSARTSWITHLQRRPWTLLTCGTDGVDYLKQASGGIVNHQSLKAIKDNSLNLNRALQNHDSYPLLKKINGLLATNGATGGNVGNVGCFLIK